MVQIGAVTAIAAEIATGRTVFQQVQQPGAAAVVIGAHLLPHSQPFGKLYIPAELVFTQPTQSTAKCAFAHNACSNCVT